MGALVFSQFTKRYAGGQGVFDLSFTIERGEWFGFIGDNGAGKSTTIRTAMGLQRPTSGTITVLGKDSRNDDVRARVGYVPSEPGLWDGMTVGATLAYLGSLHRTDTSARRRELIEILELDPARDAGDLSLGNKKKVAIVAALQHRPELLIFDEPSSGLDPLMQQRLLQLLADEQKRGATIFFSSHVLAEVERVCTRIAVLKAGRLLRLATLEALRAEGLRRVEVRRVDVASIVALRLAGVSAVVVDGDHVRFLYGGPLPALLQALAADTLDDVRIERPSLEELVLSTYGAVAT